MINRDERRALEKSLHQLILTEQNRIALRRILKLEVDYSTPSVVYLLLHAPDNADNH